MNWEKKYNSLKYKYDVLVIVDELRQENELYLQRENDNLRTDLRRLKKLHELATELFPIPA